MLAASLALFLLFEASPGDVATDVLGAFTTAEQRQLWMAQNGYDAPAVLRYGRWLGRVPDRRHGAVPHLRHPRWPGWCCTGWAPPPSWPGCSSPAWCRCRLALGVLAGMREGLGHGPHRVGPVRGDHLHSAVRQHGAGVGGAGVLAGMAAGHQQHDGRVRPSPGGHAGAGAAGLRRGLRRAYHPCLRGRRDRDALHARRPAEGGCRATGWCCATRCATPWSPRSPC